MTPKEAGAEARELNERAKQAAGQERSYLKGRAKDLWAYADQEGKRIAAASRIRGELNSIHGHPRSRFLQEAKAQIKVLQAELDAAKAYVAESCADHVEGFALAVRAAAEDAEQVQRDLDRERAACRREKERG